MELNSICVFEIHNWWLTFKIFRDRGDRYRTNGTVGIRVKICLQYPWLVAIEATKAGCHSNDTKPGMTRYNDPSILQGRKQRAKALVLTALYRSWWRLYLSEIFSKGTWNNMQSIKKNKRGQLPSVIKIYSVYRWKKT